MTQKQVQEVVKEMQSRQDDYFKRAGNHALKALTGNKEDKIFNEQMARQFQTNAETWHEAWELLLARFHVFNSKDEEQRKR